MSAECWKIEQDLCRCCHSEGSHKKLTEPYLEGGDEIFSEMLQETLNICISPVTGPLSSVTYTICEVCIMRLQDAWTFKQQVLQCESRFSDLYARNVIKMEPDSVVVSIKEETGSDNEDFKEERLDDSDFEMTYEDGDNSDVEIQEKPAKGKAKAKPKAKPKKAPPKKKMKAAATSVASTADGEAKEKKGDDDEPITMPYILGESEGKKQFICSWCEKPFERLINFSQHYRHVHLKMRPKVRSCHLCPVKVAAHMRTRHLEEAHGLPRPQCLACGKKFAYPFQVIQHQKAFHMDEKAYACPSCDMRFTVRSKLDFHARKHSQVRPYRCEYCDKTFRWKKNLATHVMAHLDDKRHVCIVCDAAFVQSSSLKYHITKKHPELI